MDPLSATASVIAILQLSAKVLSYLNDVKDTSKGRAQCAIEASNLYNLLTNLRFRPEEGHGHQSWFSAVQALAVENGPLDQFKQALETLQAKMTDRSQLEKVKEAKLSQAIKDDTSSIRTHVSAIKSAVNKVQQVQVTATQHILLEWISSSDYPAQQSDIIKRRQEGTGQWFLDAPEVARWLGDAKTTLFCPGIPGAGKTMVATIAVDQLLDSAQNSAYGVAYVYCNYKSQADQDVVSILAAILKQLVQSRPSALGPVERLHQKHAGRGTKPSLDDIYNALRAVLTQYPYVHIVVDALDECQNETRRQLCTRLFDLQKGADMRLMVTSRFVPDVEDAFRLASRLEVEASDEDVKQFVVGQIQRLPACIQHDVALQDLVQKRIVEAVDGMFLLARLHTDSLLDKRKPKEVRSTLAKLKKGAAALNSAYGGALQRIEGQLENDRKLAKDVLTWITFAKRPLTTAELCCALAVEPGESELDPENKPDVDDIVSVCAGLVVVDQESAIIRLVHYTTQEYFERVSSRLNPDRQLEIAETCLTYLSFSVFESGSCATDEEFEERLSRHELLDYAAKHGGEHARSVDAKVAYLACALVTQSGKFSCAAQVLFVPSYKYRGYSASDPAVTGLHWIARFGLCSAARELLRRKEDETCAVNAMDSDGECSLMYAVEHRHCAMAELLLDKGADVNAQGGRYGNALQAASAKGHEQVVKTLLKAGANVDAQSEDYGNSLQAASYEGHELIVKMLLENKADVNAQGGKYGNALQSGSAAGHQAIVQLLLDNGAAVNKQGGLYSNALNAAAAENPTATVRLLLKNSADVSRHDGQRKSVLHHAINSAYCSLGLVELLLSQSAPVNTTDIDNMTPLHYSVKFSHKSIVGLLLENGLSIDAPVYRKSWSRNSAKIDTSYRLSVPESEPDSSCISAGLTPLHFAALTGNLAMTKFLLERGADPNALSEYNESPIHLTLRRTLHGPKYDDDWTDSHWRVECLWDLLDFEEDDVDAVSADITMHRKGVLDALLADARTSLTIRDCEHEQSLHCVEYGNFESVWMVKRLVSRRANPFEKNLKQQNALHLASRAGDHDAVAVLLSLGVEPASTDDEGLNALHHAAQGGNHETMTILLGAAATTRSSLVTSKDTRGKNSLHHLLSTTFDVRVETVQLLLDKGVDGSELNISGDLPLVSYLKGYGLGINVSICRLMLSVEGNPLFVDKNGQNLGHLYASTLECEVQVLKILREHGVDLTQKDLQSRTILHCSAISGSITKESLHYLLYVVGVQINAEDVSGKTALQHAAEMASKDRDPQIYDSGRWDRSTRLLSELSASLAASRTIS
ncbi:unnamed protein product [Alternaria alternata]